MVVLLYGLLERCEPTYEGLRDFVRESCGREIVTLRAYL